MIKVCL